MEQRVIELKGLLKELIDGVEPADVLGRFSVDFGSLDPLELAAAEELLAAEGTSLGEIQRANELHTNLTAARIAKKEPSDRIDLIPGHPAYVFLGENEGLSKLISDKLDPDLRKYLNSLEEKDRLDLEADAEELINIIKHYDRKENLLFPYLERAGITVPPQVMWGVDDVIRDLLRLFVKAIKQAPVMPKRIEMIYERLIPQLESMVVKERDILIPMLDHHMTERDWELVAQESSIIGYVFNKGIEGASNSDAMTWLKQQSGESISAIETDTAAVSGRVIMPSGDITIDQLTAMLNTLPTDLTYIDSDNVVRYYSEGKHQVFTRTRTIIGRDVLLCHPPQLIPKIKKLLEEFRSGAKDYEIVPVKIGSKLNLVRYYAVRNEQGEYMGTVEVTEEMSEILELIESRTGSNK